MKIGDIVKDSLGRIGICIKANKRSKYVSVKMEFSTNIDLDENFVVIGNVWDLFKDLK